MAVVPSICTAHRGRMPMTAIGQNPRIADTWRMTTICSRQRVRRRLDFIKLFRLLTKLMKLFVFLVLCLMTLATPGIAPEAEAAASVVPMYSADQLSSADVGSGMDCCAIGSCNNGCVPNVHCVQGCLASVGLTAATCDTYSSSSLSFVSIAPIDPIVTNLPPDPHPPRT